MTQVRRGLTFRYVKLATVARLKEYASNEHTATLTDRTDAQLEGALEWCHRHDKADTSERFIFVDADANPFVDEIQRKIGTLYFTGLCRFRESIEVTLANRVVDELLRSPLPTAVNDAQYDVQYDRYRAALYIGRATVWLGDDVGLLSSDELTHLHRWADCVDKQLDGQLLVFLDSAGVPIASAQQKLYGWRFFNHLNRLREVLQQQLILRILAE